MVNPWIQLVLTSFIIAVATSGRDVGLRGEIQKKQWTNPNWKGGSCVKQILKDEDYDPAEKLPSVLPVEPDCGLRQAHERRNLAANDLQRVLDNDIDIDLVLQKKVVGGVTSEHGEWPWQVALGTQDEGWGCGGSLIAKHWVVTAAHCVESDDAKGHRYLPNMIKPCIYNVRLGEHSLSGRGEEHVDITPSAIYMHPDYDSSGLQNDIALIKLSEPAPIDDNDKINVVCLPGPKDVLRTGHTCQVSGWGDTTGHGDYSDVVMHTDVQLIKKKTCLELRRFRGYIKPGMLCAGKVRGGPNSCQGDSGGPLVCELNGRFLLAGVVSFTGDVCGGKDEPGVYSKVKYFMHWIESVIHRKGLN